MKKWGVLLLACMLAAVMAIAGCGGEKPAQTEQPVELNISAAASLKDALTEIQTAYQKKYPNITLNCNFGASGSLQKQIEQGAPADIFISAAPKQMSELDKANLILKPSLKNLVENKLVLIVPEQSTLGITKFEDIAGAGVQKFSIGEPESVPAGKYAQEVLEKIGIWSTVKDKAVFAKDVRSVLAYVETGNVEAGIVYKTDALISSKVKVVSMAPEGSHKPIIYPAAVLAGTKQQKAAEDFMAYLGTPESKAVFEKWGFKPAE